MQRSCPCARVSRVIYAVACWTGMHRSVDVECTSADSLCALALTNQIALCHFTNDVRVVINGFAGRPPMWTTQNRRSMLLDGINQDDFVAGSLPDRRFTARPRAGARPCATAALLPAARPPVATA